MKDTELRGIVLMKYYEKRRGSMFMPEPASFDIEISLEDILAISDQLGEHGLINWKSIIALGGVQHGMGKISALGIDVAEGEATPDIKIEFVQNKSINISDSSNVIVGDHNKQNISHHIKEIIHAIDTSHASPEDKAEAKSLLRKFVEHPLVTTVAGAVIPFLFG